MPVEDELPPKWAEACRRNGHANFAWAHNGRTRDGWVTLQEGGKLLTKWNQGAIQSWSTVPEDSDVLVLTFGSARHYCRFKDSEPAGFIVESRLMVRSGKDGYKPGQERSRGWFYNGERPRRASQGAEVATAAGSSAASQQRKRPAESSCGQPDFLDEPSFRHADLTWEAARAAFSGPSKRFVT
mmetsp:Transcript_18196/g.42550  ORF Transcript_18196/g.42550 Transcript_18196/m.42550 type:complete len:184 (-) Transcript_18196:46-597(-)|eukprot:CAMPEP_0178377612 /NCGR_PEP_ID=MMETSP0689_2-20121128/4007_1 /TAXON_ID=160604 /ORGANISM="Amphidinium massartii, Strain CS-259" /LENGTH=183 /DNA_ID=CAMNT_0019997669 /DNA_START=81 /DNA_END=632 /DNA_ORIENTATION=+